MGETIPKKRNSMQSGTGGVPLQGKRMNTIFGQQQNNSGNKHDKKKKHFNEHNDEMNAKFLKQVLKNGSIGARFLECKKGGVGGQRERRSDWVEGDMQRRLGGKIAI
ncbi:hypothetical protein BJ742DRAFT_849010 [Cladochytrium replicatum]|nr:hypothetical protein BJ742DRAFT_849010 [Cladochytrium replicatum]